MTVRNRRPICLLDYHLQALALHQGHQSGSVLAANRVTFPVTQPAALIHHRRPFLDTYPVNCL